LLLFTVCGLNFADRQASVNNFFTFFEHIFTTPGHPIWRSFQGF